MWCIYLTFNFNLLNSPFYVASRGPRRKARAQKTCAKHPRLSRGRPYRTCLPPGKSSADAKDEALNLTLTRSNPAFPKHGWYRTPPLFWERYGKVFFF